MIRSEFVKYSYLVADVDFISSYGGSYFLFGAVIGDIRQVAIKEHTFTGTVAQVLIHGQAIILRIFLEFADKFAEFEVVFIIIQVETGLQGIFGIEVSLFESTEVETCIDRDGPPVCITRIVPVTTPVGRRESKDGFVAFIVCPVEYFVPGLSQFVEAIVTVQNILGIGGAFRIFRSADPFFCIQIEAY